MFDSIRGSTYLDMSKEYDEYLDMHINAVKKCYNIIWGGTLEEHDSSKYSEEEYKAYDDYFYGNSLRKSDVSKAIEMYKIDKVFDYAWLHHLHNNPHHWQFWLLPNDDGTVEALDIPKKYIKEMVADWAAFSYINNNAQGLLDWYSSNREKQKMSYLTRRRVDKAVGLAYHKLKEYLDNN